MKKTCFVCSFYHYDREMDKELCTATNRVLGLKREPCPKFRIREVEKVGMHHLEQED